jgi:hypothetical protein
MAACSSDAGGGPRSLPDQDCGFPTPTPGTPDTRVPEQFLIEGSEIVYGQKVRGGFVTSIAIPYSVQDGLPIYKTAVTDAGFRLRSVDNEGFEAELYFDREDQLGAIQLRRSTCPDATIVYVNLVTEASLTQPRGTPN